MPVRNGEDYIREAILSVLSQGEALREIIVIDDGSTDNTRSVVAAIDDARLSLLERDETQHGVSAVRNRGLRAASGEWVMFLDADDRLRQGAIDALLAKASHQSVAIYGDYQRIDETGQSIGQRRLLGKRQKPTGDILEALLGGNFIVNGGIMLVRRDVFMRLGGFDQRFAYAEDWLAWCRLAAEGSIHYVPGLYVMDYRVHTSSVMMKKPLTLDDCLPAVDAVFADPVIVQKVEAEQLRRLRAKAIAHMEAYCAAQAIRAKRYGVALKALMKTALSNPKHLPRMMLMSAAAFVGM